MGTIWVRELTGGLDTRKMPETTPGGVLIVARDGHISRGGEFEKRAAFVPAFELPDGTVGLAHTPSGLVVFGSSYAPDDLPAGLTYQRLVHPDGLDLVRVRSWDLYRGKIYAVAEFTDGEPLHYFDGAFVSDWANGKAYAEIDIVSGETITAVAPYCSCEIVVIGAATGNLEDFRCAGVSMIDTTTPLALSGTATDMATAIAGAINSFTSTPDYTAVATGPKITITAVTPGAALNGRMPTAYFDTVSIKQAENEAFKGGVDAQAADLTTITINDAPILTGPVLWAGSPTAMATAIVLAINSYSSTPEYVAETRGASVVISAAVPDASFNGLQVEITATKGLTVSPTSTTMQGGDVPDDEFTPGTFVRTVGSKVYALSGPNLHFSGIQEPTHWNTDYTGAGFIDLSTYTSGAEHLVSMARYQRNLAVFADRVTQILYVDADPTLNTQVQQLNNTGTSCPQSVCQYGDNDLFYLDESGLRSMRARDSSGAAATNDIGVPVDKLVTAKLVTLTQAQRQDVIGLIEPSAGRFWLCMNDEIFVFSAFISAKITAWTTYSPGFDIENAVVFERKVYLRSGSTIYVYGGMSGEATYDDTVAEAWLPYLDANTPTRFKRFTAIDAAVEGDWVVSVSLDPNNPDIVDEVAHISNTTYPEQRIGAVGESTHIGVRFRTVGAGPAKLGAIVIHHESDKTDED